MRLVERALPTALFLHDGWQIVRETQGTEATGYLTGLALDEVYRRSTPTGSHDYLTDALGSILGLADSSQAITTSYTYEPYGGTAAQGAASTNPVQYTGRENDGTGLYYYRNRYYSPLLSRFVSEDPIGLEGGLNLFEYVGGNPTAFIDPLGLMGQGSGGSGMRRSSPSGQGPGQSFDDFAGNLAGHYYNFMRRVDSSLPQPDFNRPFDPAMCGTPECRAGILPTVDPLRNDAEIMQGQCRLVCNMATIPPLLACTRLAGVGIPGSIGLGALRAGGCIAVCN